MTLPNFLVIGVPKAGTTSLYDYLRPHPEIYMTSRKATRFFCYNGQNDHFTYWVRSLEEYEAQFADARDEKARGEATALYFEFPAAAQRIKEAVPDARIIASLREPVQRAFSIYHMNLRNRGVNRGLSFLEALEADPALRKFYYDGLKPYFDRFARNRIKIILFEDLARNTAETVRSLYEFLGVRTDFTPPLKVSNPGGTPRVQALHDLLRNRQLKTFGRRFVPRSLIEAGKDIRSTNLKKHVMTEEERAKAAPVFEEDLLRTQDLIGMDLSRWLRAAAPASSDPSAAAVRVPA